MKIDVLFKHTHNWHVYNIKSFKVLFCGYILNKEPSVFFDSLIKLLDGKSSNERSFKSILRNIQGHFSLIIFNKNKLFCSVDRIRSVPLFFLIDGDKIKVGNNAPDLITSKNTYNKQALIEISMSSYTIGKKTIYSELSQLCAGEFLVVKFEKISVKSYYTYSPWKVKNASKYSLKKKLTDVSLEVLRNMADNVKDRQIVIPLSAGNDSRFIASGLKKIGVENVVCFSYGLKNNFEIFAAEKIAKKLEFQWVKIPLSIKEQKKLFQEDQFSDFLEYADTLSNSQVLIDYSAVKLLKETGKISNEAIFVNGNSGDFITGGHLPSSDKVFKCNDKDYLINSIIDKHYSLWSCLKTKANISDIKIHLEDNIDKIMSKNNLSLLNIQDIGETLEWMGRQTKMVTTTQRSYEFHGYDWRLPMWDSLFMDFWESVPKEYKINQSLYIETLHENNWGGVWNQIPVNDYRISSNRLNLVRNIAKLCAIFSGKKKWHKFDRKYFSYFYDDTAATAIVPYKDVFFDKCGARDRNSWIVKKYFYDKGIDIFKI